MNWLVPVALFGWFPLVAMLFTALPPARAVVTAFVAGWLFLPVAEFQLFGFFDLTKGTAVPLAALLGVLAFDPGSLRRLRFGWLDVPVALFCVAPLLSSLSNGLGLHDALSAFVYQTLTWGVPYAIGRMYCATPAGLRLLASGILVGGLIYIPLCVFEIRMSPQLHDMLYGFVQHDWSQTLRAGGYRPMVFMHHGLMLGLWMGSATIIALALWASSARRAVWGLPVAALAAALCVTTVFCKSFGATALVLMATLALAATRQFRTSVPVLLLVCVPTTYVLVRTAGGWDGAGLTAAIAEISPQRADSLAFRIDAEEQLRAKASEKPLLGWGGWGRSFVPRFDDPGRTETVITDSLWIIVLGKYGGLGLAALLLTLSLPVAALWRRCPPRRWTEPAAAVPWALAMVLTAYAIDSLVNAMENPVYLLIAGGLSGLGPAVSTARTSSVPRPVRTRVPRTAALS